MDDTGGVSLVRNLMMQCHEELAAAVSKACGVRITIANIMTDMYRKS